MLLLEGKGDVNCQHKYFWANLGPDDSTLTCIDFSGDTPDLKASQLNDLSLSSQTKCFYLVKLLH